MLTLLRGHNSPETAYEVADYPYGGLRCKIRYWLETAVKGSKKGETRFMSQTTNPKKGHVWNKPHGSTYADLAFMVKDERGYIGWRGITQYVWSDNWANFYSTGIYHQMNDEEKAKVDALLAHSRRNSPSSWKEFDDVVNNLKTDNITDHKVYEEKHGPIYYKTFENALNVVNADKGVFRNINTDQE